MDVYEAVASRRAVRAFTGEPVPRATLDRVLAAATRAPSGGNIQPWHGYLLSGSALADLTRRTGARVAAGDPGDEPEFPQYPAELPAPYRERRSAAGERRYAALGIARADAAARARAVARNWDCFGAPAALFCYLDRRFGATQWTDIGMYLQTVMLLLRAEGLHSCPQKAWPVYHRTVAASVGAPDRLMLVCGLSIGYADPAAAPVVTDRAPLAETVTYLG
ncbi:nitroreductase [Actinocatenispora rupis]|uniref:Oxidoreductase n=1 Tax=Actinocatenispora rupis TaxID=519421 RepID=A0A8J3J4J5_9ACTN|nr:nitroreductase [Actinocatenispora rupis]GID14048.1 oxidoreductase [Actinocatenispora rupis]